MKYILLFLVSYFLVVSSVYSQLTLKPFDLADESLPKWAKEMYGDDPNVFEVDEGFEKYMEANKEQKNRHTAYYFHWRKYVAPYIQQNGKIRFPTLAQRQESLERNKKLAQTSTSSQVQDWSFVGPERNYKARYNNADTIAQISWHANMYCIDQCLSNPNVLYAGAENGGVYKTTDKGLHWQYISKFEDMTTVTAIAVSPNNPNEVIVCSDYQTYKTINGGVSWSASIPNLQNKQVYQFLYSPSNFNMIFAATQNGLYRSMNAGNTWSLIFSGECQSVAIQTNNASKVFALQYDATSKIASFYKSLDSGLTFTIKPTGWFTVPTADAGLIRSYGGRIAVTQADTNRVYVLLVGESQSTAQLQLNGQIGVYKSTDGGETWSNPHGTIGAPYNAATHPNMMTFSGANDTYNQIYYNTTIVASQLDADKILIGGMSMWQSIDGAATYTPVGGYIGNVGLVHPDNQEFKIYKTSATTEEIWFANDGGINYSTDFVQTHDSRCNGLYGSAFWGFDQGWNDDILVGGRYHNGNSARRDGYANGSFQQLGGGEAATGYVNYSNEKKTYYSDIDGVILPDTLNGIAKGFSVAEDPNESYADNASSRIMFDWDYWNMAYMGKDNSILKSTNGGSSYSLLKQFGTNPADKIFWIEQSRANTNYIYVQQIINNISKLFKTMDRGQTWSSINLPQSQRELNFTLSYNHENELWISYPQGANGNKVYHSINGGSTWTNLTTNTLNGLDIKCMSHQYGTNGGVYLASFHGPVFYRNSILNDWQIVGNNIPHISYPLRVVPFYRDSKLRLATAHLGIWENALYEPSQLVADFSANYKKFYCPGDTISFVPHCVSSSNATYLWKFEGASPSTSTAMYPKVIYNTVDSFNVTLIVTDNNIVDSITKINFITTTQNGNFPLNANFENGSFSNEWKLQGTGTSPSNWTINNNLGAFGSSSKCMFNDNWTYDAQGKHDAIWTEKYDFTNVVDARLSFDVAYAPYGGNYSDTLEVLISSDCGATFNSIYKKGGVELSTASAISSAIFIPSSTQWRKDTLDISDLANTNETVISFVNIGWYGQPIYIDNINLVANLTSVKEKYLSPSMFIYPNPLSEKMFVHLNSNEAISGSIEILNYLGEIIIQTSKLSSRNEFDLTNISNGIYTVVFKNSMGIKLTKKVVVLH